jgi:hypothetical protein
MSDDLFITLHTDESHDRVRVPAGDRERAIQAFIAMLEEIEGELGGDE